MSISGWIQFADLSFRDLGPIDAHTATRHFREFDWDSEFARQNQLSASDIEQCDPQIGLNDETGRYINIHPFPGNEGYFYFQYLDRLKVLGVKLWKIRRLIRGNNLNISDVPDLIYEFCSGDDDKLVSRAA